MPAKVQNSSLPRALMTFCMIAGCTIAVLQLRRLPAIAFPNIELPNFQAMVTPKPSPSPSPVIDTKLVVDLSDRKARLYKNKKLKATYRIAIGQEGWETPTGTFEVQQMYENPAWKHPITGEEIPPSSEDNPLGKRWIGFTSQDKLLIGFHGTTDYSLIGQAVSHGCLRMKNADVIALYKEVQVGTPVIVKK